MDLARCKERTRNAPCVSSCDPRTADHANAGTSQPVRQLFQGGVEEALDKLDLVGTILPRERNVVGTEIGLHLKAEQVNEQGRDGCSSWGGSNGTPSTCLLLRH